MQSGDVGPKLDVGYVDDKVADLAVEVGGAHLSIPSLTVTIGIIHVSADYAQSGKPLGREDDGHVVGVADQLRAVVRDDGAADEVRAAGEVDQRVPRRRGQAVGAAAVAVRDGAVDGGRVVRDAV